MMVCLLQINDVWNVVGDDDDDDGARSGETDEVK
jgi:hypothetical protein